MQAKRELVAIRLSRTPRQLGHYLTELRDEGASYREIADVITARSGVPVSHQTAKRWICDHAEAKSA